MLRLRYFLFCKIILWEILLIIYFKCTYKLRLKYVRNYYRNKNIISTQVLAEVKNFKSLVIPMLHHNIKIFI